MGGFCSTWRAVLYINVIILILSIIPVDLRFRAGYQTTIKVFITYWTGSALAANVMDFIYYKFTLRRTTADVFDQFENESNLFSLFFSVSWLTTGIAVLFWLLLMWIMVKLYNRIKVQAPHAASHRVLCCRCAVAIPLIVGLFIGAVRGGSRHSTRPITLSNAGEYVEHPNEVSLVLNNPHSLFSEPSKTKIQKIKYFNRTRKNWSEVYSPYTLRLIRLPSGPTMLWWLSSKAFSKEFRSIQSG